MFVLRRAVLKTLPVTAAASNGHTNVPARVSCAQRSCTAAEVTAGCLLDLSSVESSVVQGYLTGLPPRGRFWNGFLQAKMSGNLISGTLAYHHKVKGPEHMGLGQE